MNRIAALLDVLESTTKAKRDNLKFLYLSRFGCAIIPHCIQRFGVCRSADFRSDLVRYLLPFCRTSPQCRELAIRALKDKSKKVRHAGCAVLAYSLDRRVLPFLNSIREHKCPETAEHVRNAIAAIDAQNHNRFYPSYSGWAVYTEPPPLTPEGVNRYVVRAAPELVDRLTAVLGDVFDPNTDGEIE